MPHSFTDQQLVDIRRFCGYPLYGTGIVLFSTPWFFRYYLAMEARLATMTDPEAAVVVTYLSTLNTLEAAIPASADNLDTDSASVWFHNKQEVAQRTKLFDDWRRRLAAYLGIPTGPEMPTAGMALVV